jgi:hypothetical protein
VLGCAAVSHFIDPVDLAARLGESSAAVMTALFSKVASERDDAGMPRWVLQPAVRRRMLATAGAGPAAAWVALAAPATTVPEAILRRWIAGTLDVSPEVARHPDALRRVAGWLLDAAWVQPPVREVLRQLDRRERRRSLTSTAGGLFVGRSDELAWLQAALSGAARCAVIEAKGGMGKSALIAQLLLERDAFTEGGALVLHLDFDDTGISVAQLDTVFIELARQAALQRPELAELETMVRHQAADAERASRDLGSTASRQLEDSRSLAFVAYLFERIGRAGLPTVIVLDTVERAVRGARELFALLVVRLRKECARHSWLSLLVAGRGPLEVAALEGAPRWELGPVRPADARRLLELLGVPPEQIGLILARVPYVPLTLRLCARVMADLGPAALDEVALDEAILRARVDGYLQRRILEHLSPRLADIAQHAFSLRSITPDRLRSIVGPLVTPPLDTIEEAEEQFDLLAQATDLVTTLVPERRLVLRPEVGEEIVELLEVDRHDELARLHARAAAVLGASPDLTDQRDAQYHRGQLEHIAASAERLSLRADPAPSPGPRPAVISAAELSAALLELLGAGRAEAALDRLAAAPAGARDGGALVLGARAARSLARPDVSYRMACEAIAAARPPAPGSPGVSADRPDPAIVRAQGHMLAAEAAAALGHDADGQSHRAALRAELAGSAGRDGTLAERAELIAATASDDPMWARARLTSMFPSAIEWAQLRGAERDVVRAVCAIVATPSAISWAAHLGAFHFDQPIGHARLAASLIDAGIAGELGLGREPVAVAEALTHLQYSGGLDRVAAAGAQSGDEAVRVALVDTLARLRAGSLARPRVLVDTGARADLLAAIAAAIAQDVPAPRWRELVAALGGGALARHVTSLDHEIHVRHSLAEIDRQQLSGDLLRALGAGGYAQAASLVGRLVSADQSSGPDGRLGRLGVAVHGPGEVS